MTRTSLLWIAVVAAVSVGCTNADRTDATGKAADSGAVGTTGTDATLRGPDRDFIHDVAIANLAEIELGRMAGEKGLLADVKSFGKSMVDEHLAAGDKLKSAVTSYPVEWPMQLDDRHKDKVEDLGKKQGVEFDREYAKAMVEGHRDFVEKLESRLDRTSLADWNTKYGEQPPNAPAAGSSELRPDKSENAISMKINEWAVQTYPVARKHLESAKALEKAVTKGSTN